MTGRVAVLGGAVTGLTAAARWSVADAAEAGSRAGALELREPERLDRPERAGAPHAPACRGARGPGDEVGGERVPVATGQVPLGEPGPAGVERLRRDPRLAARRGAGLGS